MSEGAAARAGGGLDLNAAAGSAAPELTLAPGIVRPKTLRRWSAKEANSPKHQPGTPSPRTSPLRNKRKLVIPVEAILEAAKVLHPAPGSSAEKMHPITRYMRVIDMLAVPNYLRGTLSVIRGQTNRDGVCAWLSYPMIQRALGFRDPRQAINNVAELESLGLIRTEQRQGVWGNRPNVFCVTIPPELRELAAAAAARASESGVVAGDDGDKDAPRAVGSEPDPEPAVGDEREPEADAAARAEPLGRSAPPQPLPLPSLPVRPSFESASTSPAPARARARLAPVAAPQACLANPAIVAGAVLELLHLRDEVFRYLPDPLEQFALRVAKIALTAPASPSAVTQALVGLWECADIGGRRGRELSDHAIRCLKSVRDVRNPPAPVRTILRRAEQGLTVPLSRPPPD